MCFCWLCVCVCFSVSSSRYNYTVMVSIVYLCWFCFSFNIRERMYFLCFLLDTTIEMLCCDFVFVCFLYGGEGDIDICCAISGCYELLFIYCVMVENWKKPILFRSLLLLNGYGCVELIHQLECMRGMCERGRRLFECGSVCVCGDRNSSTEKIHYFLQIYVLLVETHLA